MVRKIFYRHIYIGRYGKLSAISYEAALKAEG